MFSNGVEKIDTKRNSLINPNVAKTNVSQNSKNVNERFSKAADTARENITEQTEVQNGERLDVEKYSIEYTDKNKPVVVITDNILKGVPKKDWIPTVKKTISNKFKNGIPIKGRLIKVNRKTVNEYLYSEYTKNLRSNDKKTFKDKLRASNNLDEIIVSSINYVNEDLNHLRKDNIVQFARGNVLMQIGNNQYNAKVIIGFTSGNNMLLYDLINLTPDSFKVKIKKADTHTVQQSKSTENDRTRVSADIRLPRNNKSVNEKFSVDEDTDEKAGAIHDTLKFSIDENKSKWLVNDDGKSVFDAVKDEKNPDRRISILYHYAGKTTEHGMSVGKDIRIGQSGMYVEPNEKRTHTWLTSNGLQLPLPSFKYGFSEIIKSQNQGEVRYSFEKTG
ncbi:hypothetical protein [Ruminococcus bromii]|uniref:hypothetical protein n=1 Tax=Ruminococcus bromii TaxID=40518 RepID=UPI003FD7AFCA